MNKAENKQMKHELKSENQEVKYKIHELTDALRNLKHSRQDNNILFHAQLGSNRVFEDSTPIIFDTVVTNLGGAYAPSVGVFQCPVSGYYFFAVSLVSNSHRANAAIMTSDTSRQQVGPLTSKVEVAYQRRP